MKNKKVYSDSNCTTITGGCHTTTIMYGAIVWGCTNPLATNYNPAATYDDGSCIFSGCTTGIGANSESFEDMHELSLHTDIPIAADEMLTDISSAHKILDSQSADVFILKPT